MKNYADSPTRENWIAVREQVSIVQVRLKAAIESAIAYDSNLRGAIGPALLGVHPVLMGRGVMLRRLTDDPPDPAFTKDWIEDYQKLVRQLQQEVEKLQRLLDRSNPN
jgi:hypothetical protein